MTGQEWHGRDWSIRVSGEVTVSASRVDWSFTGANAAQLQLSRRWLRWHLYEGGTQLARLRGLRRADADRLAVALRTVAHRRLLEDCVAWHEQLLQLLWSAKHEQRWITTEQEQDLLRTRPGVASMQNVASDYDVLRALPAAERDAVAVVLAGPRADIDDMNQVVVRCELVDRRAFFDQIEKQPLTEEQATAVLTYDNRVRVIAAAGSGKTSVMVARAAYAVHRGLTTPDRILLLAFNKPAADELQERVEERFRVAGIDADGVRASTFHALGLDLIGRATGAKPRPASWVDGGQDVAMVARIVDELRDSSHRFRYQWDLFRLVFGPAPRDVAGDRDPEWHDRSTGVRGFRTHAGETVRSQGERMIADWLFVNGVSYRYEQPYAHATATADHSQYRPDFYYPDIDVWHEHWALRADGTPPPEFANYRADMEWKRQLHGRHGTTLIETTWAEVMGGTGLPALEKTLLRHDVALDWNPDRASATIAMTHESLHSLVRQVMTHVKSGSITKSQVDARVGSLPEVARFRARLFFDLYWPIHEEWDRRLRADGTVDFEDMLVRAATLLESGRVSGPWDLILADEFQDASVARGRLVRGLLRGPGKHLLAVGDDWQSINRFAGADLSVLTDFEEWFAAGPTLRLQTTFRSNQQIADAAAAFVSRNPRQLAKEVRSNVVSAGVPPLRLIRLPAGADLPAALNHVLDDIADQVRSGDLPAPGDRRPVRVDVLGRYRHDRDLMPDRKHEGLDVRFRTVHGSKGLEADVVVLPRMVRGKYGFPSEIEDDPVLELAMSSPDAFPDAEERRLFYVALTRARHQVVLITETGKESAFVTELLRDGLVSLTGEEGANVEVCPRCDMGTLVVRSGTYGRFLGCGRYPACDFTRRLPAK